MSAVTVIIPARDAAVTLPATLAGLAGQEDPGELEIIVVDDGSSDATPELARDSSLVTRVIAGGGEGPAASRNRAAAVARGTWLAFLDADCRPAPGWLAAGRRALAAADMVQGAVWPDPAADVGAFDRTLWVTRQSALFESANLFVTRELFDELGGFESWLRPRRGIELGEDAWLGWRARRSGARVVFAADAVVHHAVFSRSPAAFAAQRARLRFFPAMAARIPELRDELFFRRVFHSRRSAAFDLALAGLAGAAVTRRPLALAAAAPYGALVFDAARRWGPRMGAKVALVGLAADAVGAAALAVGSIRARSPVL